MRVFKFENFRKCMWMFPLMFKRILAFIPVLFLIFTLVVRVDYRLDAPGGITALDTFITFEENQTSQSDLNSVYVMSFNRPTIFQWIVAQFFESMDVTKLSTSSLQITNTARFESGQVARNTAIQKAIITAYERLGISVSYEKQWLVYLIYDYVTAPLEIGDQIILVNGRNDILEALRDVECGEEALLVIKRDEETLEMTLDKDLDSCVFGISISEYTHILDIGLAYQSSDSFIGGPSAGLMNTLYIYDAIEPSFTLQGLKIAGTGTINIDGSVGSVGAIKQKMYTAHQTRVDIFFVPSGPNYDLAKSVYEEIKNPSFELIEVSTFDDVITYLEALNENH